MASDAATLAYSLHNEVGAEISLVDGFYDCGRGWGPTMENIGVGSLLDLFNREGSVRGREVVLIDARSDASLGLFRQRVVRQLKQFASRKGSSTLKIAAVLAKLVAERLGGYGEVQGARVASGSSGDIRRVREANGGSDIIPLGSVRLGVCRHRAALFKYLADCFATSCSDALPDSLHLRTRLVRGRFDGDNRSVGHAWNLVWSPERKSWSVIDVMHDPNVAFDEYSDKAQKYNNVAIEQCSKRSVAEEKKATGKSHEAPVRVCSESVAALGARRMAQSKDLRTKHADQSWLCPKHRRAAPSGTSRPQSFLFCPACFRRKTTIEEEREGEDALFSGPEVESEVLGRHVLQAPLQSATAWWAAASDGLPTPPCDGPHRASRGPPNREPRRKMLQKHFASAKWLQACARYTWDVRSGAVVSEDCLFEAGDVVYVIEGGHKTDEELQMSYLEDGNSGISAIDSTVEEHGVSEKPPQAKPIEWYWGSLTSPDDFAHGEQRRVGLVPASYIELELLLLNGD